MKKIYTLAAVALAVSMTASAGNFTTNSRSISDATLQTEIQGRVDGTVSALKMKKVGPAKKATSGKDLVGAYEWSYYGNLNNNSGEHVSSASLELGDNDNQIVFVGCPYTDVLYSGTFDPASQTITLKKQNTGVQGGDGEGNYYDIWFCPGYFVDKNTWAPMNEMTAEVGEDGTITFDPGQTLTLTDKNAEVGYWWMSQNNVFSAIRFFEYNAADWADLGTAQYQDGYFNVLLDKPVPAYDVQVKYNVNKRSEMLVYNPYPMSIWEGFNEGLADGYFIFDVENLDCVVARPLVKSNMYTAEEDGTYTNYLLFNDEGFRYYIDGQPLEDILEEYESVFMDASVVDGNDVIINNPYFSIDMNPLGLYSWTNFEMDPTVITLPDGWNTGVESIITDENAPVKYFNLQGMEVVNPEQGTIVIEKRGSKSVKRVVK